MRVPGQLLAGWRLCVALALLCATCGLLSCVAGEPEARGPAKALEPTGDAPAPPPVAQAQPEPPKPEAPKPEYDPLAFAKANTRLTNREGNIPPMCYTRTFGKANPCWVCHTESVVPNEQGDWGLQEEYTFSRYALTNRWSNLFRDRTAAIAEVTDDAALLYVRQDNYVPLRRALEYFKDYPGFRPDLDFAQGFDADGFAKDGSGWRALRYKPFPGAFWPTNGSAGDAFIRLPAEFANDETGKPSREVAKANYAILEAAICADPTVPALNNDSLDREVEPVNEFAAALDLDDDRKVGIATRIVGLPDHYVGDARGVAVERYKYPLGTEFLHSVRYLDPDAPGLLAARMKELRYSRKVRYLDVSAMQKAYESEATDKRTGVPPSFPGEAQTGLSNKFGWQLQAFIEDAQGRLRLQSRQEHFFCMGCHAAIGITVDQTFTMPRKVPGKAGWQYQDIAGMKDAPQAGHDEPEVLTYFKRVGGADEFRGNQEMLDRFFPGGVLDESAVKHAAKGGDKDLAWLLAPSRARAIALDKAYMAVVREQSFDKGRDSLVSPPKNVHDRVRNGATENGAKGNIHRDAKIWLDWK